MIERHREVPGIEWRRIDVRDMVGIADKSIDVAFDKATLDVMIYGNPWSPPEEVKENTRRYHKEVKNISKRDLEGYFINHNPRSSGYLRMMGHFSTLLSGNRIS